MRFLTFLQPSTMMFSLYSRHTHGTNRLILLFCCINSLFFLLRSSFIDRFECCLLYTPRIISGTVHQQTHDVLTLNQNSLWPHHSQDYPAPPGDYGQDGEIWPVVTSCSMIEGTSTTLEKMAVYICLLLHRLNSDDSFYHPKVENTPVQQWPQNQVLQSPPFWFILPQFFLQPRPTYTAWWEHVYYEQRSPRWTRLSPDAFPRLKSWWTFDQPWGAKNSRPYFFGWSDARFHSTAIFRPSRRSISWSCEQTNKTSHWAKGCLNMFKIPLWNNHFG